jgi:methyl-accepting chemotaxis protein
VEEQGSATQEVARSVQNVAQHSGEVARSIENVSHGAGETALASGQVLSSAKMLSSESTRLKAEVEKFMADGSERVGQEMQANGEVSVVSSIRVL